MGLFEERYRPIGTYSTGMKQRVKLAQALVHDPAVAFLDEPTAGLDPVGRREMLELIRRVGREFGISILISTHLMGDVERTCDRVIVLDGGRVLRTGEVAAFTRGDETVFVEVVEGASRSRRARGPRAARPQLDGSGLTLEDARRGSTTRCATRSSSPGRCSTGWRPRGSRSPTSSRRSPAAEAP